MALDPIKTNAWKVFVKLLDDIEERGAHNSDYEIPNTPLNYKLVDAANHWNAPKGPEIEWEILLSPDEKWINVPDFLLLGYFQYLIGQFTGEDDGKQAKTEAESL